MTAPASKELGRAQFLRLISGQPAGDGTSIRSTNGRVLVMTRDHLLLLLALGVFKIESQQLKLVNRLVVSFQNEGQN